MRTSFKACALFAVAALVALQSAQPASAALLDRDLFENITPSIYADLERRGPNGQTAVPTTSTNGPKPTQTIGAGCNSPADCKSGHCSRSQHKCLPAPGSGHPGNFCTNDKFCGKNLHCDNGKCTPNKPVNSPCRGDTSCGTGNCYNNKCKPLKSIPKNSGCTQSIQCQNGLFCNRSRCDNIKGAGSYCYKNQACGSGICKNNKCTKKGTRKLGAKCQASTSCESGHCWKGACRAKRVRGQPCTVNRTCFSDQCRNNICE